MSTTDDQSGPAPVPYGTAAMPRTNAMAIASLVCGIANFFCGITWILALVFGYIGKRQIDDSGGRESGREMAIAGIVLGWIGAVLTILLVIGIVLFFVFLVPVTWTTDFGA